MTPAAIIREAAADGVSLALSSAGTVKATGDQAAVNCWLPVLREHKPAIVAALADPGALWWRVGITEPGGRTIEVDAPSGWTLGEWAAYAERYHGPGCTVTPKALLSRPRAPADLDEALAAACEGVAGITKAQFRALLSPEDVADIAAGGIHRKTLRACAMSFAEGIMDEIRVMWRSTRGIVTWTSGSTPRSRARPRRCLPRRASPCGRT